VPQYIQDALALGQTLSTLGKAAFHGILAYAEQNHIQIEGLPEDPNAEIPPEQALHIPQLPRHPVPPTASGRHHLTPEFGRPAGCQRRDCVEPGLGTFSSAMLNKRAPGGVQMALTWITGLYGPARDIGQAIARRRLPRIKQAIEVAHLGNNTWVTVTASCEGDKLVSVRGCFAELYVHAYDACLEPYPVRTRAIQFSPSGTIKLSPGGDPVRWKCQIANDHIRRVSREHDAAETLKEYGKRGEKVQARQLESEREDWAMRETFLRRLVRALTGPENVGIRAVIETTDGRKFASPRVSVPPAAPIIDRLNAGAKVFRQAIRDRSNG
jgi:hypothetical protein